MAHPRPEELAERPAFHVSGWVVLMVWLAVAGGLGWRFLGELLATGQPPFRLLIALPLLFIAAKGFIVLEPNIAAVLTFFGKYAGTLRNEGFFWFNPLCHRQKISLRVANLNTPTLKVNDKAGNPIEVAAVIAWRVADTAKAAFQVENYAAFVVIQSESAVRAVASTRYYDDDAQGANSLRGDLEAVAERLGRTIQEHVDIAGLEVIEAKIAHLAYAPEIASAMLRRQQAEAVIAARQRIVEGAVGIVRQALDELARAQVVTLDPEDRVRLVTNLLTVLVSESETQPVLSVNRD
ncbi:MAG: SPFH domain-containing protein [Azonexus sp.]|jgi:regulator of protease activity HflC (stomatin/prohibitin superfamily)|nr:SPFH domain-containing protein [Betaproteobacteria bacterium]MBK8919650.1 SPFH domain-containing protein [Betaproteobacteria bacterium]MBP6034891.1 SPFH domain-containing protein [Azonexus sp.]MBP6905597.1 SPFH domain-containing protein [Azonexus sp.]